MEADGFGEIDGFGWGDQWSSEDFLGDACEGGGLDEVGAAAGCQDEGVALLSGDFIGGGVDGFVGIGDLHRQELLIAGVDLVGGLLDLLGDLLVLVVELS